MPSRLDDRDPEVCLADIELSEAKGPIKELMPMFEHYDITPRQNMVLCAYALYGTLVKAATVAGVHYGTIGKWKNPSSPQYSEAFAEAFEMATNMYVETLEAEADRRAVKGVPKGIYYQGKKVGEEHWYSDNLLMFRLKAKKPDEYREVQEHRHKVSGKVEHVNRIAGLSDEELRQLAGMRLDLPPDEKGEVIDVEPVDEPGD